MPDKTSGQVILQHMERAVMIMLKKRGDVKQQKKITGSSFPQRKELPALHLNQLFLNRASGRFRRLLCRSLLMIHGAGGKQHCCGKQDNSQFNKLHNHSSHVEMI